jgi:hypothetical protein
MKELIELHFQHERASLKMYFGQRFHTPMKLQNVVMEARASSDLSFIGM